MKCILFLDTLIALVGFQMSCKKDHKPQGNCALTPDPGMCQAAIPRYYYDTEAGKCREFTWGGCAGVVPFETMEECLECECNE